jgi:hypothetical protein
VVRIEPSSVCRRVVDVGQACRRIDEERVDAVKACAEGADAEWAPQQDEHQLIASVLDEDAVLCMDDDERVQ